MLISKGIGIDLGTTNSAVAIMDDTDSQIIIHEDKSGRLTTPSCVWFDPKKNAIVVGHQAYSRRGSRPEPITSIKRRMGTQTTVDFGGQKLPPEVISSYILKDLTQKIRETLASRETASAKYVVERGIITVPAYFDLPQIEATRKAGRLAELEVIELLHEPVAAAVYYSWKHHIDDGIFLVYDLGGGTFDVSVLRRTAGEFEVLGISGDNFLGGDDFDRMLAEWMRQRLVEDDYDLELNVENDPEDALRFTGLVALAENAKKELTYADQFQLRDSNTLQDRAGERVIIDLLITREIFESLIREHIKRTIPLCWEALAKAHKKAGITLKDIEHICLVGGSTYVPLVQQIVKDSLCSVPGAAPLTSEQIDALTDRVSADLREDARRLIELNQRAQCEQPAFDDPDTCVAIGAAIRAASSNLYVYDDQRTIRVSFRGQGATRSEDYTLKGQVEALAEGLSLDDAEIEMAVDTQQYRQRQKLGEKGQFNFANVPLQGSATNELSLVVYDAGGRVLAELGRTVMQSSGHTDIGGTLSTAVLSKPILLEGTSDGRLVRAILLPEGTSLPIAATFPFELRDTSGTVRFPLYQASRMIKEVTVEVDKNLPRGTPVEFTIHCDEQVNLKVTCKIGEHTFDVVVGPPPPPTPPTNQTLEELSQVFAQKVHGLPESEANPLIQMFKALLMDTVEALRAGDDAKAISKAADIEGLIKSIDLRVPDLEPPWEIFQRLVSDVDRILEIAADTLPRFDAAAVKRDSVHPLIEQAREARVMHDQQRYSEAFETLRELGSSTQTAIQDSAGGGRRAQDIPPEIMAAGQIQEIQRLIAIAQMLCLMNGRNDLVPKIQALSADINTKRAEINRNPGEVMNWCHTTHTELVKIVQDLQPGMDPAERDKMTKNLVDVGGNRGFQAGRTSSSDLFSKKK